MDKLKIYLDNCCYCRPFDDLSQEKVRNEATAKRYIQSLIRFKSVVLYSSFMLLREMNDIPFPSIKEHVLDFVKENTAVFISDENISKIKPLSEEIMKTGIKKKDATHIACSIIAKCDYFITTDRRVINYKTDKIKIVNPIEFAELWRNLT
ncbi:MAG: hypothetical protein FWG87_12970 [Defluviitaleaceae bacterium]|nr:hypothetical protein [Defluviitaleaceae bacterium]